jgi:hypothetical protein
VKLFEQTGTVPHFVLEFGGSGSVPDSFVRKSCIFHPVMVFPACYGTEMKDKVPAHIKKAYRGSRGIAPLILTLALDGLNGQLHAPTDLFLGKNSGVH